MCQRAWIITALSYADPLVQPKRPAADYVGALIDHGRLV